MLRQIPIIVKNLLITISDTKKLISAGIEWSNDLNNINTSITVDLGTDGDRLVFIYKIGTSLIPICPTWVLTINGEESVLSPYIKPQKPVQMIKTKSLTIRPTCWEGLIHEN